jgi:hypothetical protein
MHLGPTRTPSKEEIEAIKKAFEGAASPANGWVPPAPPELPKPLTNFETKKIGNLWYCYAAHRGYDYSFCSDNEYYAIELAKTIMYKNGWLHECAFPQP